MVYWLCFNCVNKPIPLHDEKQTLFALVVILKDIFDSYDTGADRCPAVKLHFLSSLRGVPQHLKMSVQEHQTSNETLINIINE